MSRNPRCGLPEVARLQGFPSGPFANMCSSMKHDDTHICKEALEEMLSDGLKISEIATRLGKARSTIAYWMEVHALQATSRETHARERDVDRAHLQGLVDEGLTVAEMAAELG